MEAVGYGATREAFALLALRLPWRQLLRSLATLPPWERAAAGREDILDAASRPPALARLAGRPADGRARGGATSRRAAWRARRSSSPPASKAGWPAAWPRRPWTATPNGRPP